MIIRPRVLVFILATSACAAPKFLAPPPKLDAMPAHVIIAPHGDDEKRFNLNLQPLDDAKSIIYRQEYGGGGVAVGLMLGAVGVMANRAAIKNETLADVELLKNKLPVRPLALYQDVATEFPELAIPAAHTKAVRIIPEVLVVRTDDEMLLIGCRLIVNYTSVGRPWIAIYTYQTDLKFPKAEVAQGLNPEQATKLRGQLRHGFLSLTGLYLDDVKTQSAPGKIVYFKSAFLTPRIMRSMVGQEQKGPGDRVVLRGRRGVLSFPRASVELSDSGPSNDSAGASSADSTPGPEAVQ